MGSSGSKGAAVPSSGRTCCYNRCINKCGCGGGGSGSGSGTSPESCCSCLGLLPNHNHLLVVGEEEEDEDTAAQITSENENENEEEHSQALTKTTPECSSSSPPPRFSFSFRLTGFGSSTHLPPVDLPSPPPPPPHQHHHTTTSRDPVRFSRTLSVGRLRDRVLRRTDGLFARPPTPPLPGTSAPTVEHTPDFLERRRRIRSQVRALQRLGSRFENLSGHERSCILAGHYRSGRCTCRTSNPTRRNLDDDTTARASISRIVMLAEALFEVLDEIHQQSVVLSSHSFVSSLGSIPAPKEVVDSMPIKIFTKLQKYQLEDFSQCYICLLEYEEGDCMRILPCHHKFHKTCIDKWLKEIHRVCPLCRGDVCQSDSLSSEE